MTKAIAIALFLVAVAIVIATVVRLGRGEKSADVATVRKDLADHLRIGALRSDVEAFLDERGIEHSYDRGTHTESAALRNTAANAVTRTDILMNFEFDTADSKLMSYSVREVFTGP